MMVTDWQQGDKLMTVLGNVLFPDTRCTGVHSVRQNPNDEFENCATDWN